MEENRYQEKLKQANKNIQNAQYLLDHTYTLIQDPKVLINVLMKIHDAFDQSIAALIYRDREVKLISNFHDSPQSRRNIFLKKCVKRYGFEKSIMSTITEIKEILDEHKNSPMEFARNKEFVICNDKFKFKKININDVKDFLMRAKEFSYKIEKLIQLNKFKE
jgi:hypothetical protein